MQTPVGVPASRRFIEGVDLPRAHPKAVLSLLLDLPSNRAACCAGMTKHAKRQCRWERSVDGSMLVPASLQPNDHSLAVPEESMSCMSSCSEGDYLSSG